MSSQDGRAAGAPPTSVTWADAEAAHPECSAAWDRDGGNEWIGDGTPTITMRKLGLSSDLRILRDGTPRQLRPADRTDADIALWLAGGRLVDRMGVRLISIPGVQFGVAIWRAGREQHGRWIFNPSEKTRPLSQPTNPPVSLPGTAELRRIDEQLFVAQQLPRRLQDDADMLAVRRAYLADGVQLPTRMTYPATAIDAWSELFDHDDNCACDICRRSI